MPACDATGFLVDDVADAGIHVCSADPRHRALYFTQWGRTRQRWSAGNVSAS